jgi:hypothetical protein
MDFIERLFGISPDSGNGSTEAALFIGLTMIVFFLTHRRHSNGYTWGRKIER